MPRTAKHASRPSRTPGLGKAEAAEQTRANILEVAIREFAEKGLAGARVDEIADRTATSKHMIYYHFGNKNALYEAVLEEAYRRFRSAEDSVDYEELPPEAALATLVERSFESNVGSPDYVHIIMGENLGKGAHIAQVKGLETRKAILGTIERIIARGVEAGVFRQGIDPLQLHMTISALCFYYVSNSHTFGHVFGIDFANRDVMRARCAEITDSILRICRK